MKNIFYNISLFALLSFSISHPMQESLTMQKVSILMSIIVGSGISLYIAHYYKDSISRWLNYLYYKKPEQTIPILEQTTSTTPVRTVTDLETQATAYKKQKELKKNFLATENTKLHIACFDNDISKIEQLLEQNSSSINRINKEGNTPLHIASTNGHLAAVKKLLSCTSLQLNIQNKLCKTAITLAYENQHNDITTLLLKQETIELTELLSLACARNDKEMIKQLLNHKNSNLNNNRPLYMACKHGLVDTVTLLLERNKDNCMNINELVLDQHGYYNYNDALYNPLLIACKKNNKVPQRTEFTIIIKALLQDPYINVDILAKNENTVFHFAASNYEILQLLLKKSANRGLINKVNNNKKVPLLIAIKNSNLSCVKLLLGHGANRHIKEHQNSRSLLLDACEMHKKNNDGLKIIKELLSANSSEEDIKNKSYCLDYLINHNTNENTTVIDLLLSHGADPNRNNNSALFSSAKYSLLYLNRFIDEYNGNAFAKDAVSRSILYIAFRNKIIEKIEEINFFQRLDQKERQECMINELNSLIDIPLNFIVVTDNSSNNTVSQFLNVFVSSCINYGKINQELIISLLDTAYQKLNTRSDSFNQHNCMKFPHCYGHNCSKCTTLIKYNEIITHALVQHINPVIKERHYIDQQIASIYKQNPEQYYAKNDSQKKQIYDFLQYEFMLKQHDNAIFLLKIKHSKGKTLLLDNK